MSYGQWSQLDGGGGGGGVRGARLGVGINSHMFRKQQEGGQRRTRGLSLGVLLPGPVNSPPVIAPPHYYSMLHRTNNAHCQNSRAMYGFLASGQRKRET